MLNANFCLYCIHNFTFSLCVAYAVRALEFTSYGRFGKRNENAARVICVRHSLFVIIFVRLHRPFLRECVCVCVRGNVCYRFFVLFSTFLSIWNECNATTVKVLFDTSTRFYTQHTHTHDSLHRRPINIWKSLEILVFVLFIWMHTTSEFVRMFFFSSFSNAHEHTLVLVRYTDRFTLHIAHGIPIWISDEFYISATDRPNSIFNDNNSVMPDHFVLAASASLHRYVCVCGECCDGVRMHFLHRSICASAIYLSRLWYRTVSPKSYAFCICHVKYRSHRERA